MMMMMIITTRKMLQCIRLCNTYYKLHFNKIISRQVCNSRFDLNNSITIQVPSETPETAPAAFSSRLAAPGVGTGPKRLEREGRLEHKYDDATLPPKHWWDYRWGWAAYVAALVFQLKKPKHGEFTVAAFSDHVC